jgi:transposase
MQSIPTISSHYQQLLGLPSSWKVEHVDLSLGEKRVVIELRHKDKKVACPVCGEMCSIYDHTGEEKWRHLDTMQFETILKARLPRCQCPEHGIKTIQAPWASGSARFTLLFEAFILHLLEHGASVDGVRKLTRLSWHTVKDIMNRAVERGLQRRDTEAIEYLGLDEKSFRSGHHYVTVLSDLSNGRVLDVVETRSVMATKELLSTLAEEQRTKVKAVAMDMWEAFRSATQNLLPQAAIVHDRFHISKYLNQAVDSIRRQESRQFGKTGTNPLIGSKYLWLYNPHNLNDKQKNTLDELLLHELKTGHAWALKNYLQRFWALPTAEIAEFFFEFWCKQVEQLNLQPLNKVKKLLQDHISNLLTYFQHPITNAVAEGLNSKIQAIKTAARGFHSFQSYRIRILFYCGKLDMSIAC